MTLVVYSLEDTINDFFASHPKVTQLQCDQLAISLVGGPVSPVPIQGSFSYTVVAGSQQPKIVQFRDANPDLDTEILNRARQVYGKFVADYSFHGKIGESLSVYVMEKLPGVPYVSVRFQYTSFDGMSSAKGPEHSNIVTDYAMYVEPCCCCCCCSTLANVGQVLRGIVEGKTTFGPRRDPSYLRRSISQDSSAFLKCYRLAFGKTWIWSAQGSRRYLHRHVLVA